jgi:putative hydrolase of the HAD superfamily
MGGEVRRKAVLLDAMGTLLRLEDPAPRLRAALAARLGVDVGAGAASAAIRAEIAFYRAHLHLGRDADSLAALRASCAEAMRPELPPAAAAAPAEALTAALLDALRFSAYPDAVPALCALRAEGCALVVVSNWDFSLHERLEQTGLAPLVDGAVASAELGAAKPAWAIFERALGLAGVEAARAWHAGDSVREDVEGARAAGIRAVLIARDDAPEGAGRTADRGRRAGEEGADRGLGAGEEGAGRTAGRGLGAGEGGAGRTAGRGLGAGDRPAASAGDVPVLASLDGLPALVARGEPYALRP